MQLLDREARARAENEKKTGQKKIFNGIGYGYSIAAQSPEIGPHGCSKTESLEIEFQLG